MNSRIEVLDKGFVELIDHMGDDQRVVDSARISYDKFGQEPDAKKDANLIDYLIRNKHTSPLESVSFTFHIKLPLFVAQQLLRHRTFKFNQLSGRYVEMKEEFYVPENYRIQSKSSKQSSEGVHESSIEMIELGRETDYYTFDTYNEMVDQGVGKELARIHLPHGTYTVLLVTADMHNLFHFLKLRLDKHAQWEIQQYAQAMYELIKPIVPMCVKAWEENILYGVQLSEIETIIFKNLVQKYGTFGLLEEREERILREKLENSKRPGKYFPPEHVGLFDTATNATTSFEDWCQLVLDYAESICIGNSDAFPIQDSPYREFYDEGWTPEEVVQEDMSYWN